MMQEKSLVIPAVILGVALVIASFVGAFTFYKIRTFDNVLSVIGSTKTKVVSDSVKWSSSITRSVTEASLQKGYSQIAKDLAIVKSFLASKGVKDSEINVSTVFTNEIYKYNSNSSGPREYMLQQTITVQSENVSAITDIAKNTQPVTDNGVIYSSMQPEYYYSKLAELRVNLLDAALKDAKARAEKLANASGSRVGALKSAASGVVQVLSPNSVEVSDYGQYDTSSINKEVMVTVRASFVVE